MKTTIVLMSILVGVSCFATDKTKDRNEFAIGSLLPQVIEKLREIIKQGDPESETPILDPYQFEHGQFYLANNIFSVHINVTNVVFAGLGDFQIQWFEFSSHEVALDVQIYFPSFNFTAEYYEMEGNIKDAFPLAGNGHFHFELYELNVESKIFLKRSENGKSALIDRLEKPGFSISRIVSKTNYDQNIDEIANAMIEDLLAGYLNRFNKYLALTFNEPLIDVINNVLSKYELW